MKFIHLSDLHIVPRGEVLGGISPIDRLEAALADIALNHADAAFCVVTGDLTENGDIASYTELRSILSSFPKDVHLLLGNCDDRTNFRAVFGDHPGSSFVQRAFSAGGYRFVLLDTLGPEGAAEGHFDAERQNWLRDELSAPREEKVMLFMHHPPFKMHLRNDAIGLVDDAAFAHVIDGVPIHHIFFGHVHRPSSGAWNGIPFSCVPGLAFQIALAESAVNTMLSDEPPMYSVVLLEDDRTIVHSDAFLNRKAAQMHEDAERGTWY